MRHGVRSALLAAFALIATIGVCAAQDVAIPVDVHLPILIKILTFDRNLAPKVHGDFIIGIVFQERFRTSANVASDVRAAVAHLPANILGGFPIQAVPIDLDSTPDLTAVVTQQHVNALYVAPLRGASLGSIIHAGEAAQISTLTGVPRYVEEGLAVGIDSKGDRPQIVVNVAASRSEGADFTAQMLKLARVLNH